MRVLCFVLALSVILSLKIDKHLLYNESPYNHEVEDVLDDKDLTHKKSKEQFKHLEVFEITHEQTTDSTANSPLNSLYEDKERLLQSTKCTSTTCYGCALEDECEWVINDNDKGTCTEIVRTPKKWYNKAMMCPIEDYNFELCPYYADDVLDSYSRTIRLPFPQSVQYTFCYWVINNENEKDVEVKVTKGDVSLFMIVRTMIN